jgi:hypothetical protein
MAQTLNCSAFIQSRFDADFVEPRISANADIVGPGVRIPSYLQLWGDVVHNGFQVLAAYFISATITLLAVAFGYVSGSLDDELMDDVDRRFTKWSRATVRRLFRWLTCSSAAADSDRSGGGEEDRITE